MLAKLGSIQRCLTRIRSVTGGAPASVRDLDVQEIVILNLQRAIQSCVDLAAHLIAGSGWGLPDTLKQHFDLLQENGVIERELADSMRAMVGFRNIAVHDYRVLDEEILESIIAQHLGDFEAFADAVRRANATD